MKLFSLALHALALGLAGLAMSSQAADDAYPSRRITLIVPTSPGRSVDGSARLFAESLSKTLGQPVVVDNKPGVGGILGLKAAIAAKPDGYTLVWFYSDALTLTPLTSKIPPFDPVADFTHVGDAVRTGGILIAANPANVPVNGFQEFVKLAKTKQLSYASWGTGSSVNLGFEIMSEKLGLKMLHVPFKSGTDGELAALAGQVDLVSGTSFVPTLKSGKLKPLAVGGKSRHPDLPDLPTLAELGLGPEIFAPVTYGLSAPKGTPKGIIDKLHAGMQAWLAAPDTVPRLAVMNLEPSLSTSEEVLANIRRTRDLYLPVIKRLGLEN